MREFLGPANLVTTGSIASGFLALILAAEGELGWAAGLVAFAGVCDALDGLVARRMKRECPFGSRLDSLADLVSFGAAPALILYEGALAALPVAGAAACVAFFVGGAWRLARFSVLENRHYFVGLPIPPAGVVAVLLAVSAVAPVVVAVATVVLAGLMISTVSFPTIGTLFDLLRGRRSPEVSAAAAGGGPRRVARAARRARPRPALRFRPRRREAGDRRRGVRGPSHRGGRSSPQRGEGLG